MLIHFAYGSLPTTSTPFPPPPTTAPHEQRAIDTLPHGVKRWALDHIHPGTVEALVMSSTVVKRNTGTLHVSGLDHH